MPSAPIDLVGGEGGFVATVGLLNEVARAATVAGAATPPTAPGPMRWNNNTSGFMLRRMAQLVMVVGLTRLSRTRI
jgi:hypothetical protein